MSVSRIAAAAAICSIGFGSAPSQAAPDCWRAKELDAAQVRAFQTMLMVGALQCRARYEPAADAYNWFVEMQRERLLQHGETLERHFKRENRADPVAASDRFNTALANQYSHAFDGHMTCWTVVTMAMQGGATDGEGLLRLASAYTPPPAAFGCPDDE